MSASKLAIATAHAILLALVLESLMGRCFLRGQFVAHLRAGVSKSVTDLRGRPHNGQAGDSVARRVISTHLRAAVHIVVIDQAAVAILVSVVIPMMRRVHAIVALSEEGARLHFSTRVLR